MRKRENNAVRVPPSISFLYHVISQFPFARWVIALTLLLLLLEYVSISVMIPLSLSGGSESSVSGGSALIRDIWSDLVYALGMKPTLLIWVWFFLVLLALRSLAGYAHVLFTTALSKQVHQRFSEEVFHRVLFNEPIIKVYKRSIGHYVSLAGDDTFRAGSLVQSALQVIAAGLSTMAGLLLLYLFSPLAFSITLFFLVISAFLVKVGVKRVLFLNQQSNAMSCEAGTTFLEALNSLRSIRSMSCEPFVFVTHSGQMKNYTRLLFLIEATKSGMKVVPSLIALIIGIVVFGPWFEADISIAPATVLAGTMLVIRLFVSLGSLTTSAGTFLMDARAAKDLRELVEVDEAAKRNDLLAMVPETTPKGFERFVSIELHQVHFAFAPGHPVLENLSFRFCQGSVYAIIGPSGVGKSTLADLLLGILQPDKGEILINGRLVGLGELRQLTVLVEQQPRMFSASVRDNLALGLDVSDAEIYDALDAVDLGDLVRKLPQGMYTFLEYQGSNLSGGQRQRLSIARALLRNPKILILDEATSALDADTRDIVVKKVRKRLSQGTVLFITHDSAISNIADDSLFLTPCKA